MSLPRLQGLPEVIATLPFCGDDKTEVLIDLNAGYAAANATAYTVAEGKILLITELVFGGTKNANSSEWAAVSVTRGGTTTILMYMVLPKVEASAAGYPPVYRNNSITFNTPLMLAAGDTVSRSTSGGNCECEGFVHGYLISAT